MATATKQLDDMAAAQQNLNNPANQQQIQAPPPDVLYSNAYRDYSAGKYDLAAQEFAQYMKFYPTTDMAGNAQFYLAEIEYRNGNYQAAIDDYSKVIDNYPDGNKTPAAELKKGFAYLELGQRDAGVKELNTRIARWPRSIEASQARDRLARLGPPPRRR